MQPNVIPLTPQGHFLQQLYHKTARGMSSLKNSSLWMQWNPAYPRVSFPRGNNFPGFQRTYDEQCKRGTFLQKDQVVWVFTALEQV